MRLSHSLLLLTLAAWAYAATSLARAGNVDLSTVPTRNSVQLTIYNSEDLTLVRETRTVTFKKGANPLQFSWANTLIDPTSVELKFLTNPDKLEVLDTTFPHGKPQMLYWNVQSELDGQATIQITYFTSGITWSADYLAIANKDETQLSLDGFVRVYNRSGEEYEDAQVRLVVGTINLVEKITQLAQAQGLEPSKLGVEDTVRLKTRASKDALEGRSAGGKGGEANKEKEIIKEGLSEYFIFTIEGTETIRNGWSKRMRSLEVQQAPFEIEYRYRPQEYGDQLVRMYLLANDKAHKLGGSPLPDGIVRVFRENGRDGLSYLTQQAVKYIPSGDKIELNLGPDPEVIFELIKLRASRDDIWLQQNGVSVFKRVNDGADKIEVNSSVVGWNDHGVFSQRIRNYTAKPIRVEVRRNYSGDVVFRSQLEPVLHDYQTVQFSTSVPAGQKKDLLFELVSRQGRNAKQNAVTLEAGEVKP